MSAGAGNFSAADVNSAGKFVRVRAVKRVVLCAKTFYGSCVKCLRARTDGKKLVEK